MHRKARASAQRQLPIYRRCSGPLAIVRLRSYYELPSPVSANKVARPSPSQSARDWNEGSKAAAEATDNFAKNLSEEEAKRVVDLATEVAKVITTQQGVGKKVLLYLGVGTGNPGEARVNPSGPEVPEVLKHQTEPGFLDDAAQNHGYFVIAVDCNPGLKASAENRNFGVLLSRPVALPLSSDGPHDQSAIEALQALRSEALKNDGRFVVMNSVTDKFYAALFEITRLSSKQAKAGQAGHVSYLTSYEEDDKKRREAFNVAVTHPAKGAEPAQSHGHSNANPKDFAKMTDVFDPAG